MSKLDDYTEERILGKGAFGKAILVRRNADQKLCVMKVVNMSEMKNSERQEALQEASVLKQFNHPNIVKYYDCFQEHHNLYIIMEYANNGDLAGLIEEHKQAGEYFKENDVLFYFV